MAKPHTEQGPRASSGNNGSDGGYDHPNPKGPAGQSASSGRRLVADPRCGTHEREGPEGTSHVSGGCDQSPALGWESAGD
jgi:hypothetical protein